MTLVIAGHLSKNELFVVADSAITNQNGSTLLGGFRKIYPVTARLWKPYFVGEYFRSFNQVFSEAQGFVAFSGSTLTAQHVLNCIVEHLANLRVGYDSAGWGAPGRCIVQRHCETNALEKRAGIDRWDEDIFSPDVLHKLLTADEVADVVHYSIEEALSSARQYKLTPEAYQSMKTDYAFGIICPVTNQSRLYEFRMCDRLNADGILEVFSPKKVVSKDEVVVLGMRQAFEARAQATFAAASTAGRNSADEMVTFLNMAIDEVQKKNSKEIDRPSTLKILDSYGVKVKRMARNKPCESM